MAKAKFKSWLLKFLPAEIVGTVTAVCAASFCHIFSDNGIFIAYIGSLGEAIGFYLTIIIQNIISFKKKHQVDNRKFSFKVFAKIISTIVIEFGPAGVIDGLFLRPFLMFIFPLLIGDFTLGILVGKIVGDFTFYGLVIMTSEIKTHIKSKKDGIRIKKQT
ncbi:MAG: hypothetical protein V4622_14355 [Bacteroidota bacterium]